MSASLVPYEWDQYRGGYTAVCHACKELVGFLGWEAVTLNQLTIPTFAAHHCTLTRKH